MCGIAGIYTPGRAVDTSRTRAILDALQHRGPDGEGQFIDRDLALLHTRLSIIDLEHGRQPLHAADQQAVLVANGEIYNHPELRAGLIAQGARFLTGSDCEVVLPLYQSHANAFEYPERFCSQLNGMFAFALFDRQQRSLLLVRDRFGIKPLYYSLINGGVAFASEIKALLPMLDRSPQANGDALARFLQINFSSGDDTAIEGIRRLPPGGFLRLDAQGRFSEGRWWDMAQALEAQPDFTGSETDAVETFDHLLQQSMCEHLRSDVPVGLFLSGGVDSSILARSLQRAGARLGAGEKGSRAWSLGFETQSVHDEASQAQLIAQATGVELELIRSDPVRLFDRLVFSIWAGDELMGDFANLPTLALAQQASASHKVVLSGEGGDEVFAGYGRYRMPRLQRWLLAARAPGSGGFRTRGRFSKGANAGLLQSAWRQQHMTPWRDPFILHWQQQGAQNSMTRMQAVDMQTWLVDDLLVKADRMLMAYGVEGRVPFLDHRLVLFGLSLPDQLKRQGRIGKIIPRRWLEQNLQSAAQQGRKKGFTVPVRDWLQALPADALLSALTGSALLMQITTPAAVKKLIARQQQGDKRAVEPLAAFIQLAIWSRLYIEGTPQRPPEIVEPISWLLDHF
ncbi:asparagine synthase (glutamine-hydrolyzing) [Nitrincola alkalilacustris]|uniref:asparagine synthase (glutamine-hydrolyzing) n=1 Tax=Nitrincola alkalilacustris TaxID=1571224 RepID=UPI00124D0756|nr:asparagine synthase (glutamine-hydrolyzing) [Nitrincola alkalilacustris]